MGTTLTGTTPQDTYDSLIKVTDNAPLTGSLKVLTDGLGNDSALALSTGAASVTGTLAVSGNATFDTNTLFVNASTDRVGVGTVVPNTTLSVVTSGVENTISPIISAQNAGTTYATFNSIRDGAGDQRGILFQTYEANVGLVEKVRITSAGNVGIGTSAPATKLQVVGTVAAQIAVDGSDATGVRIYGSGTDKRVDFTAADAGVNERISGIGTGGVGVMTFSVNNSVGTLTERVRIQTDGGISFNGDTAAANALDDYEEGTWTIGVSFGGASVAVTTSANTGTYTKIGRQVTVNGLILLTSKGSSAGAAVITGLPFTIANNNANYSASSLRLSNITFANQFQSFGDPNTTTIVLNEITEAGAVDNLFDTDFANNSSILVSLTYFV